MLCPNCKNEIDDDSRFCRFCGVEFVGEEEPVIEIQPEPTAYSDASLSSQVKKITGRRRHRPKKKRKKRR